MKIAIGFASKVAREFCGAFGVVFLAKGRDSSFVMLFLKHGTNMDGPKCR
jgi:hypothetical protein